MKSMIHSWKRKSAQYRELKKQKGVTLLEIIIVLGIIGIIAAGVIILAQRAFKAQDISGIIDNTNSVRVAMSEAYKDQAEYPVPTNSITGLTKANIATEDSDTPISTTVKMGKLMYQKPLTEFPAMRLKLVRQKSLALVQIKVSILLLTVWK